MKIGGDDLKKKMNQIENNLFRDKIEIFGELTISEKGSEKMKIAELFYFLVMTKTSLCILECLALEFLLFRQM